MHDRALPDRRFLDARHFEFSHVQVLKVAGFKKIRGGNKNRVGKNRERKIARGKGERRGDRPNFALASSWARFPGMVTRHPPSRAGRCARPGARLAVPSFLGLTVRYARALVPPKSSDRSLWLPMCFPSSCRWPRTGRIMADLLRLCNGYPRFCQPVPSSFGVTSIMLSSGRRGMGEVIRTDMPSPVRSMT
jgi:hypothetical protein